MITSKPKLISLQKLTTIWGVLLLLTISTAIIGHLRLSGLYPVSFILFTVFIKGLLIIDYYMGLKNVKYAWRYAMIGFVTVIPIIALVFYYFSQSSYI